MAFAAGGCFFSPAGGAVVVTSAMRLKISRVSYSIAMSDIDEVENLDAYIQQLQAKLEAAKARKKRKTSTWR